MKFILIVLLSVFSVVKVTVQSELICSHQPIVALPGDDVILPCRLEPVADAGSWRVEWTKPDLNPEHIHVHEDGRLLFQIQNPSYNHRTRLFVDELMNGNVSMKIFKVKLSDGGKYRCFIPSIQKEAFVQLTVEEPKVIGPDQPIRASVGDDVVLPCFLKPPINVMTRRVDWKHNERFVHVYRSRADDLSLQDENFKSRTSLFHDEFAKGNISLKLTNVTEEDAGHYTCIVTKVNDQIINGSVHLIVDPMRDGDETKRVDNSLQSELICSHQPIVAPPGDDVILPCRLEPAADADSWRVEWTRPDLNPEHIHVHEDGRLLYEIQNPSYNFRTRLFVDELMNGNVSMKIFKVKVSDGGKYRCFIPSIQKEAFVQLSVEEPKVIGPDQPIRAAVGDDVVLPCFLKPPINVMTRRVDWKHNESFVHVYRSRAEDLSLQDENFKSRTSLFHDEFAKGNISLKLTNVTEEDAGNYTCTVAKVNDQIINGSVHLIVDPMREGDETTGADNSSSGATIATVLCLLAFVGIGLFVSWWKCRKTNERQDGRESSSQNLEDQRARLSNVENTDSTTNKNVN